MDNKNNQSGSLTEEEKAAKKLEKLEKKRQQLLNDLSNCNLNTLEQRVAWLLNHKPETRNSDVTLQVEYWKAFESDLVGGSYIDLNNYKQATRLPSIARSRAHIQNDHNLFLASEEIRKRRGKLEEDKRSDVIVRDKPSKSYSVFADESGKTDTYLIVGSLWILNGIGTRKLIEAITKFKHEKNLNSEFHFKRIDKNNLQLHLEFLRLLKEHSSTFSFKALHVERKGIKNVDQALNQLFFNLLCLGVEHENSTGRAPLPRSLSFDKDMASEGPDKLMLADIKEKLRIHSATKYNDDLYLDEFRSVDSKDLHFMQIADLFTSSINRTINTAGDGPKDIFAKAFLLEFGMTSSSNSIELLGDCTSILDMH
ncbi:DUF3800 domain-containing protein [Pseudoalteromonas galatheae]|uniref:DUF3800 domain-containing protein n=1 Tax=Pseudoalteromonas galatheae TaxID=579562 RepID=UPI0030CF0877